MTFEFLKYANTKVVGVLSTRVDSNHADKGRSHSNFLDDIYMATYNEEIFFTYTENV